MRSYLHVFAACSLAVAVAHCGADATTPAGAAPAEPGGSNPTDADAATGTTQRVAADVPITADTLSFLAVSDDGRVVVVTVGGSSGTTAGGDYKKNPMFAYERDANGTYALLSELPDLQNANFNVRGASAISGDGSVLTVTESTEGLSTLRVYERSGATFQRRPESASEWLVETQGTESGHLVSRDGSLSLVGLHQYNRDLKVEGDRSLAGIVWASRGGSNGFQLEAPKRHAGGSFGRGLAYADGAELIVVGEPGARPPAVYVFDKERKPIATLQPNDAEALTGFGSELAVSEDGSLILVGAPLSKRVLTYVKAGDSWDEAGEIVAPDGIDAWGDNGVRLSSDGTVAVVGSSSAKLGGAVSQLYVAKRSGSSWTSTPVAIPNATSIVKFAMARAEKSVAVIYNSSDGGIGLKVIPL